MEESGVGGGDQGQAGSCKTFKRLLESHLTDFSEM